MNNNENKKWYLVLAVFAIIFTFFGGSLAYWQWETNTSQRTNVVFTVTPEFKCEADGGGDITEGEKYLVPTDCTNSDYAIQRTITVKPTVYGENLNISFDLGLKVNSIGTGLKNSKNFRYALTTDPNSCTTGIVEEGTFYGLTSGKIAPIFNNVYSSSITENYYLYIWLDKAETSAATMDQSFSLSLTGSCTNDPEVEPEEPELDPGMIPVTISNTGVVTTISEDSEDWYDYSNKEWANVVLVDSDSRNTYLNTTGTTVNQNDILAYYVWVPRYKYRIRDNVTCSELENPSTRSECYSYTLLDSNSDGSTDDEKDELITWWQQFMINQIGVEYTELQATTDVNEILSTGGAYIDAVGMPTSFQEFEVMYNSLNETLLTYTSNFNDNNIVTGPRPIDISFEPKIAQINNGDAVDTYKTHPAFIWDGETIGGLWVGKFETSTDSSSTCYISASSDNCNNTNQEPRILPNVSSLRYQNVSNQFQTALKFSGGTFDTSTGTVTFSDSNIYGLSRTTDSHMMKNSEWGAVAYLSHSKYGINYEVRLNNNSNYTTGCGASEENGASTTECQIAYGGVSDGNYPQSTTGNITGIFDISGGTLEYVMGNYGNTTNSSGFTTFPSEKYYDLYSSTQFTSDDITLCTLETCGGHALYETVMLYNEYETVMWYNDFAGFAFFDASWLLRGGDHSGDDDVGMWSSTSNHGGATDHFSFRSLAIVNGM